MKKIAILGCGWLGFPLAKSFVKKGYEVNGATTSVDKILHLAQHKINPFLIAIHQNHTEGNLDYFLKDLDTLIINIPPRLRKNPEINYFAKIKTLTGKIKQSNVKNVIFVSSSSVYGNSKGEITETTVPQPETESAKQLLESEKLLIKCKNFSTTIVRFAGLYGPNRHPVTHLSGKQHIANPKNPVNLIHLVDCIGIIQAIIENKIQGEIINGVAPFHPSRESYYTQTAREMGIEPPIFDQQKTPVGKAVTSNFINTTLGYEFVYPDLKI